MSRPNGSAASEEGLPPPWRIDRAEAYDPNREVGALELAEMVAVQRSQVEQYAKDPNHDCEKRAALERTLRYLEERLRNQAKRGPAPGQLDRAVELADIFTFQVPTSHRKGVGRAVTAGKRALLKGLKPFHVEVLRPQQEFNAELVRVLRELFAQRDSWRSVDVSDWLRRRLDRLSDPTHWQVRSHRKSVVGKAVNSMKKSYLGALRPVLSDALNGQREWNAFVIEAVAALCGPISSGEDLSARLCELKKICDPLDRSGTPLSVRILSPLWREVLRRQTEFNHEITNALSEAAGIPASPPAPAKVDYSEWYRRVEPAQIEEAARRLADLSRRPLISIVVPTYDTPEAVLRECLDSVLAQSDRKSVV